MRRRVFSVKFEDVTALSGGRRGSVLRDSKLDSKTAILHFEVRLRDRHFNREWMLNTIDEGPGAELKRVLIGWNPNNPL